MKMIQGEGMEIACTERGSGEETVVLSHSYLVDHRQLEPQIEALSERYRVIAYDHRDHGRSGRARGPCEMKELVADAVRVIEQTGAAPCHWVGLSTGGFVGQRLALGHRELLQSLVLMDTSGEREPWSKHIEYEGMFLILRLFGVKPLQGTVMSLMFGSAFRGDPQRAEEVAAWRERIAAQ